MIEKIDFSLSLLYYPHGFLFLSLSHFFFDCWPCLCRYCATINLLIDPTFFLVRFSVSREFSSLSIDPESIIEPFLPITFSDGPSQRRTSQNQLSTRISPARSTPISFKYELDVDVRKMGPFPFSQTMGKSLFHAELIQQRSVHERLILLYITGDREDKEAQLNVQLPSQYHIVRILGLVKHAGEGMLLLQEYASRGSLLDVLRVEHGLPTLQVVHDILLQIIDGLIFLTEQGIVHGGLACRNILVFAYDAVDPHRNVVKLTDFGISRRSNVETSFDVVALLSAAPEVLQSRTYSEKSDVWAFAVLAWEIFSKGGTPMIRQDNRDFTENDRRILAEERLLKPSACPSMHWAVLLECMKKKPSERPTFVQLQEKLLRLL